MPNIGTHLWKKNKYGHWTRITDDNTGYVEINCPNDNISILNAMPKIKRRYGSWVKTKSWDGNINIKIFASEKYLESIWYDASKIIHEKE